MKTKLENHLDKVIAEFPTLTGYRVRLAQIARSARLMDKYKEYTDEWLVADDAFASNANSIRAIIRESETAVTAGIVALVREERTALQA